MQCARTAPEEATLENTGTRCVKRKTDALPLGHLTRCLCVHTHASTHKQAHDATVNNVCLRQGVQADKHVWGQSRQGVVGTKVEAPVGEEGDTR